MRRGQRVSSFEVPGRAELAPKVRLLLGFVEGGEIGEIEGLGTELFDALLRPGWSALSGVDRILVVADGPLRRLPFSLLRHEASRWLFQDVSLSSIPSATLLRQLRDVPAQSADRPVLAFAQQSCRVSHRYWQAPAYRATPPSLPPGPTWQQPLR